ncbi:MAG: RNA polymerase sigma factor [Bacteroidales bacterium]|jgi:RNA polymerase sigma-70 factor (ECF subfamily)|nr:RNA polymerase sigma factor [Bacteroidales bacterium]
MTVAEYNKAVEEFADAVYRFIRADIRDDEKAKDIVQDSYEKLWRNVAGIEFRVAKSWLFTCAYNRMIDIIRKENRISFTGWDTLPGQTHEDKYSDLNEILHQALSRLPDIQRSSVLLRDYEGYSYKEIGEITGQSEAQVKINIYRGRIALKSYIGKIETVI